MRLKKLIYYNYYSYLIILWLIILPITIIMHILEAVAETINKAVDYSDYRLYERHKYYIYKK